MDDSRRQLTKEGFVVRVRVLGFLLGLISIMFASHAFAQTPVMKQFLQFGGGGQGLYWVPSSGPISPIAFLAIHRTADYLAHPSTQELPRRAFTVLALNSRFNN